MPTPRTNSAERNPQGRKWQRLAQWLDQYSYWLMGLLGLVFILSGALTLHNYGITWDEGLGNLFFGEKNLRYLTSFDPSYLDPTIDLPNIASNDLALNLSLWRDQPYIYPAFTDMPPTLTKWVFSDWLKWLDPIDGFHLYSILLAGVFLWVFFRFTAHRLGKASAWIAVLFLATFPRFWGDMHFNIKDIPETVFFSLTLMTYLRWYEHPTWRRAILPAVFMGCALGVKANALFLPFFLIATIAPWQVAIKPWLDLVGHFRRYFRHYLLMAGVSIATYLISWPMLYGNFYLGLKGYWGHIFHVATGGAGSWKIGPLVQALTTMPETMLAFLIPGLILGLVRAFRTNSPLWRMLIVWLIFPILRMSIPSSVNFDGIRHYLEFVPAAALIAAFGVEQGAQWIARKKWMPAAVGRLAAIGLLAVNLIPIYSSYYPYTHLYYNQLTGGLSGAKTAFLGDEATDYWAGSYRPGMEWLNENAPLDSKLVVLMAPWVADIEAPLLLRPDIQLISPMPDFSIMTASAEPYYLMFILRGGLGGAEDEIDYTMEHGTLAYAITVDQVRVCYIYRFGGQ